MELLERTLEAHGGAGRWQDVYAIMARVSLGGFGLASRLQPSPVEGVQVTVLGAWPSVTFTGWPEPDQVAHCQPNRAWITRRDGRLVAERTAPGAKLRSYAHWLWWDYLDVLYYAGNVLWQSLCLPFTLLREGCHVAELAPLQAGPERLHRLAFTYPADIPCLRSGHVLCVDTAGRMRRLDFTPRVGLPLLRVAQRFTGYETASGFAIPAFHRMYPCLPGARMVPLGPLAWIDVDDISAVWVEGTAGAGH